MADAPTDVLAKNIEAHDASAVAAVSALTDRRLIDARNRTLFDVAILANNADVITVLASDRTALEFSAPIDATSKDAIKHAVAMTEVEVPISKLETYVERAFGEDLAYGRTPLQTACRSGNVGIIETLLTAGAKTNVKDVLGLTAPELSYFGGGENGLLDFIAAFCRSNQTRLPVGKRLLAQTFLFPETMAQLLDVAKLDAAARRLLFCYRCAWLDIDAVSSMLSEGHDPNKGVTPELNPLWQASTSAMLWDDAIPGGLEMAIHYTKHVGHPGANAVSFDNDLLNEDGSNFDELFADAERKRTLLVGIVNQMTIDPDAEREMTQRRTDLLNILFDAGADITLARKKQSLVTFSDLKQMRLGDVAAHLKRLGGAAPKAPKKGKSAASTYWELVGETGLNAEYWPADGEGGLIRLVLHNVYGPVDGVTLSVQLAHDIAAPDSEWHDLKPTTETVEIEGEMVSRAALIEKVYGDAPWETSYDLPLKKAHGTNLLSVRLDHKDETQLRGELDPWKFAKD